MVGSAAGVDPTAAVRAWGQLAPVRRTEVAQAESMMRREGIGMLSSTTKSIEEIAATVLTVIQLERE